jgi:hypothetical protein
MKFDFNKSKALNAVKEDGYYIFQNAIPKNILNLALSEYFTILDTCTLHAQGEKFTPLELKTAPWRKLAAGSKTGSGEAYSQLLQTTYLSQNDHNFPTLSAIFCAMIQARNEMTGMSKNYGANLQEDEFWNACRIHHYPQGGGHMASHKDTLFPKLLANFEIPFLQIMITLSSRGHDFNKGGGYINLKDGKSYFFETPENSGSLILFNGSTIHGVDDVDPEILLDFRSHTGRIALFVNLYLNLNHKKSQ